MLTWLALSAIGLSAGVLGALLGLGGGIFLVPALTLIFDIPIHAAIGTSLVGVIATSAGVASVSQAGRSADIQLALRLEIATTAGALVASLFAASLSQQYLALVFAAVVLATAAYTFQKTRRRRGVSTQAVEALFSTTYVPRNWLAGLTFSAVAGGLSGLAGVGGGFIKVPVMYSVMGVPMGVATATSNFMVGITAAASAFIYYGRGDIYPLIVVPTALGVFFGAVLGARLAPRLRIDVLRQGLILLLILVALQMAWKGITGS